MPIDRLFGLKNSSPERSRSYNGFSFNPILAIIAVNLLVSIIAILFKDWIINNLGLVPILFLERPWTIITNMFVHAGFGHIFGNMMTLFFFGRALSQLIGDNKFLLVYFVGGIVGNILYLLLGEPLSIAIGASGAVYAVAGTLVVLMPKLKVHLYFLIPMPLWVVILVFFGIWSIPGFMPGIAWQAHLGGLLTGLVAGYYLRKHGHRYYIR
ncbi:rhomboid family intramembrane serine protease [Chloroflexota bacterium]